MKTIAALPALKRLDLDSHVVTDVGIGHLKRLARLEHISLRALRVTDESLRHLAEIKSLTRIDLDGTGNPGFGFPRDVPEVAITASGLLHLKSLPNLRALHLANFGAHGSFFALKELSQLRELSFTMCELRKEEFDMLEEALPKARIHHATGGGSLMTPKARRRPKPAAAPTPNADGANRRAGTNFDHRSARMTTQ